MTVGVRLSQAGLGVKSRKRRTVCILLLFGFYCVLSLASSLLGASGRGTDGDPAKEERSFAASRRVLQSEEDSNATTSCIPPAIEQFPRPLMSQETRKYGGLLVHIVLTVYMFFAVAVVCDEYFVPSLEVICERLQMSEDVAGATFMAAGSSAPELATAVIAVFVAKDDIGISGVIGSAVFNILFVISVCALFAGQEIPLHWWPLLRDTVCYCVSIFALLLTIYNEVVTWYESIFLLLLYAGYCVTMWHNKRLEEWANTLNVPFKDGAAFDEKSSLCMQKTAAGDSNQANQQGVVQDNGVKLQETAELDCGGPRPIARQPRDDANLWEMPIGLSERIRWALTLPVVAVHYWTIPDCRKTNWRPWYVATFVMSMVWISAWSYVMVWMITIIGFTLGIPDTVMGLTFIAVGVSVPDAVTSLCVAKQGYGDMAVSNAIGSNVFDILLCLGLPWFLKTVVVDPGSTVIVESRGLTYSTVSLFSTVIFLIAVTHWNGWKLDKKYAVILLLWYFVFMVFASLYELNVFGAFNPPECNSLY